jgi:hypothetical protein
MLSCGPDAKPLADALTFFPHAVNLQELVMKNPVAWFEIYVDDMARAKAFYEAVFKLELTTMMDSPEMTMLGFPSDQNSYGVSGALSRMPGFSAGRNSVLVYFSCEDCAVEADRAVKAGGKLEKSKTSIGEHGYFALVTDTEGNMIGLHSMA